MTHPLLDSLNESQKNAVTSTDGPLLILAGAGSGKTRVIIHRIAWLIKEKNVPPFKIFAVTFTNKAAAEMRTRISQIIGSGDQVFIRTFHSSAVTILRRFGSAIGLDSSFSIYDSADQEAVIKEILVNLKVDPKKVRPAYIASVISGIKDKADTAEGLDPAALFPDNFHFNFAEVYEQYHRQLKARNALDFNDLLLWTYRLLKQSPETLDHLQNKWHYFMVDEYQDTNRVQYLIIRTLASKTKNLCVVGDDDQSIYSWRGADIRNILDFEQDYPQTKVVTLDENYRSTSQILDSAYAVISNNVERKEKRIHSVRGPGERPVICSANNEYGEAEFVLSKIEALKYSRALKNSNFAIFYRTNAQSRIFEDQLRRRNISYRLVGGLKFYDRKEIKDIVSYLRFINNPFDTNALLRIINTPTRGIGDKSVENLRDAAYTNQMSEWEVIDKEIAVGGKTPKGIAPFRELIHKLMHMNADVPTHTKLSELITTVIKETKYLDSMSGADEHENTMRKENLGELINSVIEYEERSESPTLAEYLQEISLLTSEENPVGEENDPTNFVTLMTVHNAKGLEYPVVFLTGMEEGIFPHFNSLESEAQIEEERRLAYVGITRAKEMLFISSARLRRSYAGNPTYQEVSRFVQEIPQELVENEEYQSEGFFREEGFSGSGFSSQRSSFQKTAFGSSGASRDKIDEYRKRFSSGASGGVSNEARIADFKERMGESGDKDKVYREFVPARDGGSDKFKPKDRVVHPRFGSGTVIAVSGSGDNVKLTINFASAGLKSFLEKYTPLEKAE